MIGPRQRPSAKRSPSASSVRCFRSRKPINISICEPGTNLNLLFLQPPEWVLGYWHVQRTGLAVKIIFFSSLMKIIRTVHLK